MQNAKLVFTEQSASTLVAKVEKRVWFKITQKAELFFLPYRVLASTLVAKVEKNKSLW